jgi:cytochrome c-type biogenesis protein CcmE
VPYATRVLTSRMHMFTIVQVISLAILWIINESSISLSFPFFLILMVPLRKSLEYFYTPSELEAVSFMKLLTYKNIKVFRLQLDGVQQKDDEDDISESELFKQINVPAKLETNFKN